MWTITNSGLRLGMSAAQKLLDGKGFIACLLPWAVSVMRNRVCSSYSISFLPRRYYFLRKKNWERIRDQDISRNGKDSIQHSYERQPTDFREWQDITNQEGTRVKNQALSASQVRMSSGGDATSGCGVDMYYWNLQIRGESGLLQVAVHRDNEESQGCHWLPALSFGRRDVPVRK